MWSEYITTFFGVSVNETTLAGTSIPISAGCLSMSG
jgi:hypothetical protein